MYQASLRVFEPLAAFPGKQARRWRTYLKARERTPGEHPLEAERSAALQAIIAPDFDVSRLELPEGALYATWEGNLVVCPLDTRSRFLQAIVDSEWQLPFPLNTYSIDRSTRRQAASLQLHPELTGEQSGDHIMTANWQVPFWWCLLFDETDVVPTEDLRQVTFRNSLDDAIGRAEVALKAVTETFGGAEFISDLTMLLRWLGGFDRDSMIELDYGSLADFVVDELQREDTSVALAGRSLAQLLDGDVEGAVTAYHEYAEQWEQIARIESWN